MTGNELYRLLLTKYRIQLEMLSKDYALGMTSIGDTKEGFDRLADALFEIDKLCQRPGDTHNRQEKENDDSRQKTESDNNRQRMLRQKTSYMLFICSHCSVQNR